MCGGRLKYLRNGFHHHHHHHGGPSVLRMTLSVLLICGYLSFSAGRSWTCRAVCSLGTRSSHLSLGYRLPSGGVLWRTVLDGDALPLAQMTQIVKVCASAVCPEQQQPVQLVGCHTIASLLSLCPRNVCRGGPVSCYPALALQTVVALEFVDPLSLSHGLSS